MPEMEGVSYLAFILPVAVVSAAIGAASSAVETLAKDIERGYFWRLIFAPAYNRQVASPKAGNHRVCSTLTIE